MAKQDIQNELERVYENDQKYFYQVFNVDSFEMGDYIMLKGSGNNHIKLEGTIVGKITYLNGRSGVAFHALINGQYAGHYYKSHYISSITYDLSLEWYRFDNVLMETPNVQTYKRDAVIPI